MQSQRPVLVQQQRLKLSPQLYQSIQLMALPLVDLRQRIADELEANPALELVRDGNTVSLEDRPDRADGADGDPTIFRDDVSYDVSYGGGYDFEGRDNKHSFIEGALARPESLQDHLVQQLRLQPVNDDVAAVAELLIHSLDENGFLRESPEKIVPAELQPYIGEAQALVSQLDPLGTCVMNYRESLQVQLAMLDEVPAIAAEIVGSHLDMVQKQRFSELARKLRSDEETVMRSVAIIKTLNPFPGRLYSADTPRYIIPDLSIENRDGELVIVMNDDVVPVLGVNDFFPSSDDREARVTNPSPKGMLKMRNGLLIVSSCGTRPCSRWRVPSWIFSASSFSGGPSIFAHSP